MIPASSHNGYVIRVRGQVQGVGFRPFIWQLANELALLGEVLNDSEGVLIKLLEPVDAVAFVSLMVERLPPLARIDSSEINPYLFTVVPTEFVITQSQGGQVNTRIAPDTATCTACIAEIRNPADRRVGYPFTNCTHCGPRFSIIKAVPYDRPYTSMGAFPLCPECQQEYDHPADRRFHAQPNACATCGPKLTLVNNHGEVVASEQLALAQTIAALEAGQIVAIKGLGGYHLAVDATNQAAVERLRRNKHRPTKPFALMARDLTVIANYAMVTALEQQQLQSGAAPIVLLKRNNIDNLAANVAPSMHRVGMMLPSNPLQHLIFSGFERPLVMTSGNASGKPPVIDDAQAVVELGTIADLLLQHNRAIVNRVDDSIVRVDDNQPIVLRRARGFVPTPIGLPAGFEQADNILAYGADLKNTFCYLKRGQALLSPHLGDLSDLQLRDAYQHNLSLFAKLFDVKPTLYSCDPHPSYHSFAIAKQQSKITAVGHHHAHMAACMVDNQIALGSKPMLALVLDGLGWGGNDTEHQLWGGELLYGDYTKVTRLDGIAPMALLGGELAAQQPWRNLLVQLESNVSNWQSIDLPVLQRLQQKPLALLRKGLQAGINSPKASSAGRLFDAAAALLTDKFESITFEGEAAMSLESLAWQAVDNQPHLPLIVETDHIELTPIWSMLLTEICNGVPASQVALLFHQQLALCLLGAVATQAKRLHVSTVVLSGGVMQNQLLHSLLVDGLRRLELEPLSHHQIPANDGGLSLGQAAVAWAQHQQGGMA
ncbi:carbamoyltransferase HypF [Ferrimonas lipolytica]|uniref:Carbamoyltransferase HypF n=1 Tax=Ferrimonas lipolytica TaxID=2724191 RepID=A0A6H1UC57_9GAMM|nr:carbamoyltransferase HypF [Ferrimonas lipolytica]QIZ76428.1 carbamoyltransferase HypF [Ferrimonas lipolytica]